ncbi:MAG: hypothetical protein ACJAS1_003140 [Oleiphilaceae bacterium]|jgi:hypothetical protein
MMKIKVSKTSWGDKDHFLITIRNTISNDLVSRIITNPEQLTDNIKDSAFADIEFLMQQDYQKIKEKVFKSNYNNDDFILKTLKSFFYLSSSALIIATLGFFVNSNGFSSIASGSISSSFCPVTQSDGAIMQSETNKALESKVAENNSTVPTTKAEADILIQNSRERNKKAIDDALLVVQQEHEKIKTQSGFIYGYGNIEKDPSPENKKSNYEFSWE